MYQMLIFEVHLGWFPVSLIVRASSTSVGLVSDGSPALRIYFKMDLFVIR